MDEVCAEGQTLLHIVYHYWRQIATDSNVNFSKNATVFMEARSHFVYKIV